MPAWQSVAEQALNGVQHCFDRAGDVRQLRLHGDCRMGPAVQDLWRMLSGDREAMSTQLADILEGYERFHEFDSRELHLVEALRLIHYSAWLARRWMKSRCGASDEPCGN